MVDFVSKNSSSNKKGSSLSGFGYALGRRNLVLCIMIVRSSNAFYQLHLCLCLFGLADRLGVQCVMFVHRTSTFASADVLW
mmetsp:Transcript_39180/g.94740  ORF Transcript_39180/g.94740 Transcript_39180/m.94740 type:complete len:81 (-) Transcript_39180:4-246(-)